MSPKQQQPVDKCPVCGAELEFDEVDIGVGVQRGNAGCPHCHWTPQPSRVAQDDDFPDDVIAEALRSQADYLRGLVGGLITESHEIQDRVKILAAQHKEMLTFLRHLRTLLGNDTSAQDWIVSLLESTDMLLQSIEQGEKP